MVEIIEYKDGSWSYIGGGGRTVFMTKYDEKPKKAKAVAKATATAPKPKAKATAKKKAEKS